MAIVKSRPRVRLLAPKSVVPGVTFELVVLLEAKRDVPLDFVRLLVTGVQERRSGQGSATWFRGEHLRLGAELAGARTIAAGTTRLAGTLQLPPASPPTYSGRNVRVHYVVEVHASVPWWPDARGRFELHVGHRKLPGMGAAGKPVRYSTAPEGPVADEPWIEGSLQLDAVPAGGRVEGAFALGNLAGRRVSSMDITLLGLEHVELALGSLNAEAHRFKHQQPPGPREDDAMVEFVFRLPADLPPSGAYPFWSLGWQVEVRARRSWRQDLVLRMPFRVLPLEAEEGGAGAVGAAGVRAVPSVGSDRVRELWARVGEAVGLALDETGALVGSAGGAQVRVHREHRGGFGLFLVADLAWEPLHLDLALRPRSLLGRLTASRSDRAGAATGRARAGEGALGPRGVHVDDAAFRRRYGVTARDASQARALLGEPLCAAIRAAGSVYLGDDGATVTRALAGSTFAQVQAFASAALELARALGAARANVPPPEPLRGALAAWQDFAALLGGSLETARMAVTGRHRDFAATVVTKWAHDGEPLGTEVAVALSDPPVATPSVTRVGVEAPPGGGVGDGELERCAKPARALLLALVGRSDPDGGGAIEGTWPEVGGVEVDARGIRALVTGALDDPRPLLGLLDNLVRLAWLLAPGGTGPYR